MKYLLNLFKEYMLSNLGYNVDIEEIDSILKKDIPFALLNLYEIHKIQLFQKHFIVMLVTDPASGSIQVSAEQISQHLKMIRQILQLPCIVLFDKIDSYTRKRFIEKKIPFVIPGKQMYLPDLLIDLKENSLNHKTTDPMMAPATQFLLLYHLQKESLEGKIFKELAEKFNYDNMTISRAAYYMHNMGLCEIVGTKEKCLSFQPNKKQLWENALPMMTTPIKLSNYYSGMVLGDQVKKSGLTALSHYTMLNSGAINYYAETALRLKYMEGVNFARSNKLEGNICMETWKYDPYFMSEGEFVDKLSLYLSLREHTDERIQIALDELLNGLEW